MNECGVGWWWWADGLAGFHQLTIDQYIRKKNLKKIERDNDDDHRQRLQEVKKIITPETI